MDKLLVTAHSERDGAEGEDYPDHLTDIFKIYSKLKEGAESPDTLTNSQQNRLYQNDIIGDTSPTGPNTNASSRASTAAENRKNGHYSVEKLIGGNAIGYTASSSTSFDDSSDENSPASAPVSAAASAPVSAPTSAPARAPAPTPTPKENSQRKKKSKKNPKKYSTEQTLSDSNDQKTRMADAICELSNQQVGKVSNDARINLDKDKFDYHRSCQNNKEKRKHAQDFTKNEHFEKKLSFRVNLFDDNKEQRRLAFDDSKKQRRLAFLKEARDSVVLQYTNATDDVIKELFKEDLKRASAMYMEALQDY
eukprot:scaffold437_cov288-Chaetoceros_neogracile.AAC.60